MIKGILVLIGVVIVITFGYFVSNRNDKNTKVILIIIGVIGLLAFAYFTRIDGYLGRIEQFSRNTASYRPNSLNLLIFYKNDTKPLFN